MSLAFSIINRLINDFIRLLVDDVVDGIAIQMGGGYAGLLGVPLFKQNGLLTNPSKSTAWVNILVTLIISNFCTIILSIRISLLTLRVDWSSCFGPLRSSQCFSLCCDTLISIVSHLPTSKLV